MQVVALCSMQGCAKSLRRDSNMAAARTTKAAAATEEATEAVVPEVAPVSDMNIFQRIVAIRREVGALAPQSKGGVPFPFRGIDGTVNHLAAALNKYEIVVVPSVVQAVTTPNAVGSRTVKTTEVTTRFDFYAPDGSMFSATTVGLADDFADRSAAQAQSVAFRIALLQTFFLPTQQPEPEETGQAVMDNRGAPAAPQQPRSANTVAAAKADSPEKLKAEVKIAAGKQGWTAAEINAKGNLIAGGEGGWLNNADVLAKLKVAIEANEKASA